MNGIVVVPRRRVAIAATDAKAVRAVFIREGLANPHFDMGASFVQHTGAHPPQAKSAEAKSCCWGGSGRSDVELVSWV